MSTTIKKIYLEDRTGQLHYLEFLFENIPQKDLWTLDIYRAFHETIETAYDIAGQVTIVTTNSQFPNLETNNNTSQLEFFDPYDISNYIEDHLNSLETKQSESAEIQKDDEILDVDIEFKIYINNPQDPNLIKECYAHLRRLILESNKECLIKGLIDSDIVLNPSTKEITYNYDNTDTAYILIRSQNTLNILYLLAKFAEDHSIAHDLYAQESKEKFKNAPAKQLKTSLKSIDESLMESYEFTPSYTENLEDDFKEKEPFAYRLIQNIRHIVDHDYESKNNYEFFYNIHNHEILIRLDEDIPPHEELDCVEKLQLFATDLSLEEQEIREFRREPSPSTHITDIYDKKTSIHYPWLPEDFIEKGITIDLSDTTMIINIIANMAKARGIENDLNTLEKQETERFKTRYKNYPLSIEFAAMQGSDHEADFKHTTPLPYSLLDILEEAQKDKFSNPLPRYMATVKSYFGLN